MAKIFLWIYTILMVGGGYMGYAKAGSKMSLIMGIISGIVLAIGLSMSGSNPKTGLGLVVGMSAFLSITFLIRLIKTGNFMPAGMLFVLSLLACTLSICQFMKLS